MTSSVAVLLASPMSRALTAQIVARYGIVDLPAGQPFLAAVESLSENDRARVGAIVGLGTERIDARGLARLPGVGMICCLGSRYDAIDLAAGPRVGQARRNGG